jgi:hypothetical protein
MLCNECVVERVVKGKALRPARLGFCFTCYVTSHGNDREKMSHTKTIIAPLKAKSLTCIECDGLATVRFGENTYRGTEREKERERERESSRERERKRERGVSKCIPTWIEE